MKKRIISALLALCMVMTLLPAMAFATSVTTGYLIANPGGETVANLDTRLDQNGWTENNSPERGYSYTEFAANGSYTSGIVLAPHSGTYFMGFYNPLLSGNSVSGLIYSTCYQDIDITKIANYQTGTYSFSGWFTLFDAGTVVGGTATVTLSQLDTNGSVISGTTQTQQTTSGSSNDLWDAFKLSGSVNASAKKFRVAITGNLPDAGLAAFDDLSLILTTTTLPDLIVTGGIEGTDYTYTGGVLTVKTATALTIANTDQTKATANRIEVTSANGANLTLSGVNIDASGTSGMAAFKITTAAGAVNLTLADGSANTLKSGANCAGLQKDNAAMLTIHGGTNGTGSLHAVGGSGGAGIGANPNYDSDSSMTITGGSIITESDVAGIGGGDTGAGIFNVVIAGGNVSGTVGGGSACGPIDITVSGGSVNAVRTGESPKNGSGTAVQLYTLTVNDENGNPLADAAVTALTATPDLGYTYGMTDVKTDADGKLYVYLPAGKTAVSVTSGGKTYSGSVTGGTPNTAALKLVPPTAAEYAAASPEAAAGTDYVLDTEARTLAIKTAKGAAFFSASGTTYLGYAVKLDADVNVGGFLWTPVGNSGAPFTGTFDGQNHTIGSLTVTALNGGRAGVFGAVGSSGIVKNLTVSGSVSVRGSNSCYAAGIVGYNYGLIDHCASGVQVTVTSQDGYPQSCVGGIVGSNSKGTIRNCRNSGALTAASSYITCAGGIVGDLNGGSATNCFSTGAVSAGGGSVTNFAGGIAGDAYNSAALTNCYSAGTVTAAGTGAAAGGICGGAGGVMTNCFWLSTSADKLIGANQTTGITGCGSFDNTGALTAGTAANCGGVQTLAYGANLLAALNGWVSAQASADYLTWLADNAQTPANAGCPVFGGVLSITPGITITAAGKTYDGSAIDAPTVAGNGGNGTVTWYSKLKTSTGDYVSGLPKDAGTWSVKAHVAASGIYTAADSTAVDVTIVKADQTAPAAGAGYAIDYTAETITVTDGYEVSATDFGAAVSSGASVTPGGAYYVRLRADDNHNASGTTSFILPARPTTPGAPSLSGKTDTSITVTAISGQEYSIDSGASWQDSGAFTGLTANTDYSVLTRVKSMTAAFRSADSQALPVATKHAPAGSVSAPVIGTGANHPTDTAITVSISAGQEYVISTSADDPESWSGAGYFMAAENGIHTFENLTPATKYFIHTRTAETDNAMPSGSAKTQQYTRPTAPNANVVTIDYANETVSFAGTLEVYTAQIGGSPIISGGSIRNHIPAAGSSAQIVYVRVKAVSGGAPESEWTAVTVPSRPANGAALTVDTATETVAVPTGYSYQIGSGSAVGVSADTAVALAPGAVLTCWKNATGSAFKSAGASVTAPARLTAVDSTAFTVNGITEKLPTAAGMQYSTDSGATWKDCAADMALTAFGWDGTAAKSVQVRMKATTGESGKYASDSVAVTIPARAAAPAAAKSDETIFGKADGKLTGVSEQMEYRKSGASGWTAVSGTEADQLKPGAYEVRTKATAAAVHSNAATLTIAAGRKLTLTFDAQGGTEAGKIENIEWQKTVAPPATARTGYTFGGWFTAAYGAGTRLADTTKIEADATYFAKWTACTYTVTFHANDDNATGEMGVQTHTYDAALALTANAFVRAGYSFSGWNTASDGGGTAYTDGQNVKNLLSGQGANLDLHAQWTEAKRHNLTGVVTGGNAPVSGAAVTLKQGATVAASTFTDSGGKYLFSNLLPGSYNLVVTKDGKTVTVLCVIEKADATRTYTQDVVLPTASSNSSTLKVEKDDDVKELPKIVVGGLEALAEQQGADISMIVRQKAEDKNNTEQSAVLVSAGGQSVGLYLDVALKRDNAALKDAGSVLEIVVPYDFSGKRNVRVWRYHGGDTEEFTALQSKPVSGSADKTFFADEQNNLLYLYASKFSTYAVSYTQIRGGGAGSYPVAVDTAGIKNGNVTVSPASASAGTKIIVTVKPDAGCALDKLTATDDSGNVLALTDNGNGTYSFTMPSGKANVSAVFVKSGSPFTDVAETAYYHDAVLWAADKGVTAGKTDTHFDPDGVCTRAQAVTFLWRALGSPEPTGKAGPFTDVAANAYYYKAVLWATETGVTVGTGASTFSPDDTVTRAQAMTFLWRASGKPAADAENPFGDVASGAYYRDAALWAAAQKITQGTTARTFSPDDPCTRAQIVTFLYRRLGK